MPVYKFMDADGKELDKVIRDSTEGARLYAQEKEIDYETIDICEEDLAVTDTPETKITAVNNTTQTVEYTTKIRKPRADKGQKRSLKDGVSASGETVTIKEEKPKKKVTKKDRKHPEYFILCNETSVGDSFTHDEALDYLSKTQPNDSVRVIMGREVHFTRKVQFKIS
jgi:hypothetical protein